MNFRGIVNKMIDVIINLVSKEETKQIKIECQFLF
jgi:hypothetical protein